MIITRTPYRISFFGGGSDYPAHYREHGGSVLSTTINHFCRISLRRLPPFFEHRYRVVYSRVEEVKHLEEIRHPSVRACLSHRGIDTGVEIHHDGDLPARSGIGSSSSFTVGLLAALSALEGKLISREELAEEAIHVEQNIIRENVGSQDQISAAYGGFNTIRFFPHDGPSHFSLDPVPVNRERLRRLNSHLMLFFTGIFRNASDIAAEQLATIGSQKSKLKRLEEMVDEARRILCADSDITGFGHLLHEGWSIKKSLSSKITSSTIDDLYHKALQAGATGGKLLGAGNGGFLLFFVAPELQQQVKKELGLLHVPFSCYPDGSHILYYTPEEPES